MICPKCSSETVRVLDSRDAEAKRAVRRRRECESCQYRFTTYERLEKPKLIVAKKDHTREPYSREKLIHGLWRALEKRPVTQAQVDEMLDDLEEQWVQNGMDEVTSTEIGEAVMERLKELDEIAYIRFASVYRSFKDVDSFKKELSALEDKA